jgi:predicted Zn-dependent peptidase
VAISHESNEHLMLSIGKSLLVYNRIDSLEEIAQKIDSVSSSELLDIANEILAKNQLSILKYS